MSVLDLNTTEEIKAVKGVPRVVEVSWEVASSLGMMSCRCPPQIDWGEGKGVCCATVCPHQIVRTILGPPQDRVVIQAGTGGFRGCRRMRAAALPRPIDWGEVLELLACKDMQQSWA